jgi:DNA (cytosine-5)-methyltransferase 1
MGKLKVLDLFSGIGGFSYGLEKTGLYETVAFCEWDKKCQSVLNKHWPSVPKFSDIANLVYLEGGILHDDLDGLTVFTKVDVITGGFPCQDISLAGKGAGIEGERSGYWKHYKRLIQEIKPKGVIIENVSALRNRGLDQVLQDLHEVGYDAEWHCIPASHLGATHQRDRIWIIAHSRSFRGERLKSLECIGTSGQGWEGRKTNLQRIYSNPFGRSDSIPQPLLRGMDVRLAGRVDRLKQVGNSVYWPIVEQLGIHLHRNLVDG